MKKILFLLVATVFALAACDSVHEDISNGGHITLDELKAMSTISVDKTPDGSKNGNVITCSTSAPVNAKWDIGGKEFIGNYARKKMKVKWDENGDWVTTPYTVVLTAICPDGTKLTAEYPVKCDEVTDPLVKYYIYGDPDRTEEEKAESPQNPFMIGPGGDAAPGRFSDGEGRYLPYLSDEIYFGKKALIFEIIDAQEGPFIWGAGTGCTLRVMNGWWSTVYADDVPMSVGLWELQITDQMAAECAQGGEARDLNLLMTRGSITIKSVYYEE